MIESLPKRMISLEIYQYKLEYLVKQNNHNLKLGFKTYIQYNIKTKTICFSHYEISSKWWDVFRLLKLNGSMSFSNTLLVEIFAGLIFRLEHIPMSILFSSRGAVVELAVHFLVGN